MINDSTARFSSRVDDYMRYRPSYPAALIDFLRDRCGVAADAVVADVGAGTGISTRFLLEAGHRVTAVEPNPDMRAAADRLLSAYPHYASLPGTAEATTLADASVDLVTAFQAFHWFDPATTRREFARILRPAGRVALIWNSRPVEGTPFLNDYESLLQRYAIDYREVSDRYATDATMAAWFDDRMVASEKLVNVQRLNYDGLAGRLRSASYIPREDHPNFAPMMAALRRLFDAHARDGVIEIGYTTIVYVGTAV